MHMFRFIVTPTLQAKERNLLQDHVCLERYCVHHAWVYLAAIDYSSRNHLSENESFCSESRANSVPTTGAGSRVVGALRESRHT